MRIILLVLGLASFMAFGEDGTLVYQAGNVAYVFPWKLCLIISGVVSLGIYALRK